MGSIEEGNRLNVNSICIIGAGPSGLAAAKYLLAERAFSRICLFEQRADVGGLWNYLSYSQSSHEDIAIPQVSPHAPLDRPTWGGDTGVEDEHVPHFMSPIYDHLETNIPRELMGFSDLDWRHDCQLFPKHETVLHYLQQYAQEIRSLIKFQTQVIDVSQTHDKRWTVQTRELSRDAKDKTSSPVFDAVLVANGHFNVPYVPSVPGIQSWVERYPGTIIHSKFYRKPEAYAQKKIIVVGNSASGVDIAAQVAAFSKSPLIISQKSESYLQPGRSSAKLEKPQIVEYIPEDRSVLFADGTVESGIDAIIYCTGYFYSFPFLESLKPPLITTGECVENTFQHIFYRPQPTLAFAVLNQKIIPFPLAEAQSAVIARVWSGRLQLPSESDMEDWERQTRERTGGGRTFHVLKFPQDADYINMLHDWAMTAEGEGRRCGELHKRRMSTSSGSGGLDLKPTKSNEAVGETPPYWGEKEYWMRERFPSIKKAFQDLGDERHSKRTLEDVGFDFEEWKKERIAEDRRLL